MHQEVIFIQEGAWKMIFEQPILNEVLSQTPPDILYHYTDQFGLLGIIKDREIWASHHQCLNDTQEFLHAKSLIGKVIDERKSGADRETINLLDEMKTTLEVSRGYEEVNLFVASFSADGDSLSQWRAYGGQTAGFALGFKGPEIKRILPPKFNIVRCIYKPSEQQKVAEAIVAEVLGKLHSIELVGAANLKMEIEVFSRTVLHAFALIFKDHKFKDEKEWRIVSRHPLMEGLPSDSDTDILRFDCRTGKSMLIPYWKIRLHEKHKMLPLQIVFVGPNPNMEQSVRSLRSFLKSQQMNPEIVQESKVPYRNW
jgi:hypothetical protein